VTALTIAMEQLGIEAECINLKSAKEKASYIASVLGV